MNYVQKQKEYQKQIQQDQNKFDRIYIEKQKNNQIEQIPKLIKQFHEKDKDYTQMISKDLKEKIKNQKENQISYYNIVSQENITKKNNRNSNNVNKNFRSIHQGEYNQLKKHFNHQIQLSDFEKQIYQEQLNKMVEDHDMPIQSIYKQYMGQSDEEQQKQKYSDQKIKYFGEDGMMIQDLDKWKKNKRNEFEFKESVDQLNIKKANSFIGKPCNKLGSKNKLVKSQTGRLNSKYNQSSSQRIDQIGQQQQKKDQNILNFLKRREYQYTFDDYQKDEGDQKYQLSQNSIDYRRGSNILHKQELNDKIQEYCEQYPKMNSIYESLLKKTNLEIKMKLDNTERQQNVKDSIQIKNDSQSSIQLADKVCLTQDQYIYLQKNQEKMKISIKQLIKIQENENQELIYNFNQKIKSLQNWRLQLDNRIRNATQMNSNLYMKLNEIQQAIEEQQVEIDDQDKKQRKTKASNVIEQSQQVSSIDQYKQRQSKIEEKGSINIAYERCKQQIRLNQQLIKQNTNQKVDVHQRLQVIQRSFGNLLLQILKKGNDVRTQGLVWILEILKKQGVKVQMQMLEDNMPKYLDQQSIRYLFEYFKFKQSLGDIQHIQQTQLNFYQLINEQDQNQQNYLVIKLDNKSELCSQTQMSTMQTNNSRFYTQRIEEEEESNDSLLESQFRRNVKTETQFSYFQNVDLKNSVQIENQNRSNYKYLNPIEIKNDQIQLCDDDHLNFWVNQNNKDKSNLFERTFQQGKEIVKKGIKLSKVKVKSRNQVSKQNVNVKQSDDFRQSDEQFHTKIYDDDEELNPFSNRQQFLQLYQQQNNMKAQLGIKIENLRNNEIERLVKLFENRQKYDDELIYLILSALFGTIQGKKVYDKVQYNLKYMSRK